MREIVYFLASLAGAAVLTALAVLLAIVGAFAEMVRELIRERTNAGLAASRARGRKGGRRPKLTAQQICHARKLLADPETTIKEVAASLKVNRATIYRSLGLGAAGRTHQVGQVGPR
jgi:DNA invertase Pin-like site-specific DNA recombinase